MNDAVVIGHGYVGKATCLSFGIDKWYTRTEGNCTPEEAAQMKYVFICTPTPTVDGKCFTDDIYDIIKEISSYGGKSIFIVRSTVWPGFADMVLDNLGEVVVSNPEFLSEATWEQDAKKPDLVVIGSKNIKFLYDVQALYMGRFKYIKPILTDNVTAELIKWTMNAFFSTKTIFTNEMYDVAKKVGANWETIKMALQSHPYGTKNHLDAWYRNRRGVHGNCLPKDLWALAEFSRSPFFKMLIERNAKFSEDA